MTAQTILRCQCGEVECTGQGGPFLSAACYCDDCQEAARQIEAIGKGPPVSDPDGGTALGLIRDDKFRIERGAELLRPHQLIPDSSTSRMVASCCNSAMFLQFSDGRFWKSVMLNRTAGPKPEIEMRFCTRYRVSDLPWPDTAPRYAKFPLTAFWRVAKELFAMKIGR
jgi:hypothetical protein